MKVELEINNCKDCFLFIDECYCKSLGYGIIDNYNEIPYICPLIKENKEYMDLINKKFNSLKLSKQELVNILIAIKVDIDITEEFISTFIKNDIFLFGTKEEAFNWYIKDKSFSLKDLNEIKIKPEDIIPKGLDLEELVIDKFLSSKHNFLTIESDTELYMTWNN